MKPGVAALSVSVLAATMLPLPMGAQADVQPPLQRTYPVQRLQPSAFLELPKNLIAELQRRGCTIPQPYTNRKANVIRGEFQMPGQTDCAVLCLKNEFSSILVFWNGSERNQAQIAKWQEEPTVIYDHFINPVGRKFIVDHYRAYGGRSRHRLTIKGSNLAVKRRRWCCTTIGESGSSCKGPIERCREAAFGSSEIQRLSDSTRNVIGAALKSSSHQRTV